MLLSWAKSPNLSAMPIKDSTQFHYYQQMSQQIKMVAIGCVVIIATLVVVGIIVSPSSSYGVIDRFTHDTESEAKIPLEGSYSLNQIDGK